jgi:hypothetical protein
MMNWTQDSQPNHDQRFIHRVALVSSGLHPNSDSSVRLPDFRNAARACASRRSKGPTEVTFNNPAERRNL